jgi:hypothetical protein
VEIKPLQAYDTADLSQLAYIAMDQVEMGEPIRRKHSRCGAAIMCDALQAVAEGQQLAILVNAADNLSSRFLLGRLAAHARKGVHLIASCSA